MESMDWRRVEALMERLQSCHTLTLAKTSILSTNFETLASSDLNGEQAERLLDITVALVAGSDANLRQEAATLMCARVEISPAPPDAVVRALELGLRSTSDPSCQLFTVELLTDLLEQELWCQAILGATSLNFFISQDLCPLSPGELSMSCQLSSYATMKQQLLARDTFLSAAFRMLPLFPALGESFDHMRVCIIHQMASEDESALIEEDLTTSALNLLEMVLSSSEAACHEVVAPRNFSLWARFRKILLGNRNFQAQSACLVVLQLTLENVGPSEAETLLARYDLLTVLFEHLGFHQPEEVTTEILRSIELLCAVPSQAFKRSVDVGMANLLAVAGRAVHDGHSNLLLQWYRCIECLLHPSRNGVRDIDSVAEAAALGLTYHHDPEVLESCWHALLVILNDTERRSIKAEAAMYQSLKMLKVCERSVIAHEGAMLNFLACLSTILDRYEPTSELCQEVLQGIKDSVVPRVMESSGGVSLATFGGLMGILGLAFSKEPTFGKGYAEAALRSGSLGTCSEALIRCQEEMDAASTASIVEHMRILCQVMDFAPENSEEAFSILETYTLHQLLDQTLQERMARMPPPRATTRWQAQWEQLPMDPVEEVCASLLAAALAHGDSVCEDDLAEAWVLHFAEAFTQGAASESGPDSAILAPETMAKNLLTILMVMQQRRSTEVDPLIVEKLFSHLRGSNLLQTPEIFLQLAVWVLETCDLTNQDLALEIVRLWTIARRDPRYRDDLEVHDRVLMGYLLNGSVPVQVTVGLLSTSTPASTRLGFLEMLSEFAAADSEGVSVRALLECQVLDAMHALLLQDIEEEEALRVVETCAVMLWTPRTNDDEQEQPIALKLAFLARDRAARPGSTPRMVSSTYWLLGALCGGLLSPSNAQRVLLPCLEALQAQLDPTSEESTRGIRLAAFAFVLLALAAPPSSGGGEGSSYSQARPDLQEEHCPVDSLFLSCLGEHAVMLLRDPDSSITERGLALAFVAWCYSLNARGVTFSDQSSMDVDGGGAQAMELFAATSIRLVQLAFVTCQQVSVDLDWPERVRARLVVVSLEAIVLNSPSPRDLMSTPWNKVIAQNAMSRINSATPSSAAAASAQRSAPGPDCAASLGFLNLALLSSAEWLDEVVTSPSGQATLAAFTLQNIRRHEMLPTLLTLWSRLVESAAVPEQIKTALQGALRQRNEMLEKAGAAGEEAVTLGVEDAEESSPSMGRLAQEDTFIPRNPLERLSAMLRPEAPLSKEGLRDQIVATMRAVSSS